MFSNCKYYLLSVLLQSMTHLCLRRSSSAVKWEAYFLRPCVLVAVAGAGAVEVSAAQWREYR